MTNHTNLIERLTGFEALVADYSMMLEKADDIALNVLGNDLREVQSVITEAAQAIEGLRAALRPFANMEVPAKREGNAGIYSIRFSNIERAQRLTKGEGDKLP